MNDRDRGLLLREATAWDREGLLAPGALATLQARLAGGDGSPPRSGFGTLALHGAGGGLLGAAAIALVELQDLSRGPGSWLLFVFGLAFAVAGLALLHATRLKDLGEALAVAALVDVAFAAFRVGFTLFADTPDAARLLLPLAFLTSAGLAWSSRDRVVLPPLATIALLVTGMLWFEARLDHRTGPLAWLAVGVVDLAAVVLVAVPRRWPWATSVLAILPAGVALGAGLVTGSTLDVRVDWVPPLLAALASGVLLALGVALHQRGLSAGAALALSGSAIACAFRLGGVVAGVVVLVLCGAALLGLATALRQKEAAA